MTDYIVSELRPDIIQDEMVPVWTERSIAWGQGVLNGMGFDRYTFSLQNPLVKRHLADFAGDRIRYINDTTRALLQDTLVEGFRAGEGYIDMSKRVSDLFGQIRDYRSDRIARTEVTRSGNFATTEAYKMTGLVHKRQWISTPDEATRPEHHILGTTDAGVVGINEPFEINGEPGMYPGDFEDVSQVANCRCTTVALIDDPPDNILDELVAEGPVNQERAAEIWHKGFEKKADAWESAGIAAMRRAFAKQEDLVQKRLQMLLGR